MAAATAVEPWTTACSPASMIFPGALAFTSISLHQFKETEQNHLTEMESGIMILATLCNLNTNKLRKRDIYIYMTMTLLQNVNQIRGYFV